MEQRQQPISLVSIDSLARLLGISRQGLHQQLRRGTCAFRVVATIGTRRYFDRAAIVRAKEILSP